MNIECQRTKKNKEHESGNKKQETKNRKQKTRKKKQETRKKNKEQEQRLKTKKRKSGERRKGKRGSLVNARIKINPRISIILLFVFLPSPFFLFHLFTSIFDIRYSIFNIRFSFFLFFFPSFHRLQSPVSRLPSPNTHRSPPPGVLRNTSSVVPRAGFRRTASAAYISAFCASPSWL